MTLPGAPAVGTVIVKVVQGTQDAAIPAGAAITVELRQGNQVVKKLDATLDATGVAMLENVRFMGTVRPVVAVEHAGVTYQGMGQAMTAAQPDQIVRVVVHEVTEQAPAWRIAMRHVMVHPTATGVHVIEVMSVENPSDRTWRAASAKAQALVEAPATQPADAPTTQPAGDGHDNGGRRW